jgi:hypothetical protein
MQTHRQEFMKYAVEILVHTKFHKGWFRYSKVNGELIDTQAA